MKRAALVLAAVGLFYAAPARARTPEIAIDPLTAFGSPRMTKFIFQTLDRWTVFAAGATINKMVVDQTILWLATDDGVIRFETGSQRSTRLTMDDGLPSQRVSTVAFDDQYVWFGTNKGLVRYRKTDRTIKVYDENNGLPNKTVTYCGHHRPAGLVRHPRWHCRVQPRRRRIARVRRSRRHGIGRRCRGVPGGQ
jgi:ligand-binding sensor domain-containing protein